jgi:antitoxin MazE
LIVCIMEVWMRVAKWGNSLAVRLPKSVVDELALVEGDEINICAQGSRIISIEKDARREEIVKALEAIAWPVPPGFRWNRDEANER